MLVSAAALDAPKRYVMGEFMDMSFNPSEEEIAALKAEHEEIYAVDCDDLTRKGAGKIIFKQPSRSQMKYFFGAKKAIEKDPAKAYDTLHGLSLDFVVYPHRDALSEILDHRQSLCVEIFERVWERGSAAMASGSKKL